jgi:hypothetical protein
MKLMQNGRATRNEGIELARDMRDKLSSFLPSDVSTASGRSEWTRAIWNYFTSLSKENEWKLYPEISPQRGRVAGEYLVDFAIFDTTRGCRIACESEWGDIDGIDWAFDKLRAMKADLKILVFQLRHESGGFPVELSKRIKSYLACSHHHHPGHEFYIFLQLEGSNAKAFLWEPKCTGPLSRKEIELESIE